MLAITVGGEARAGVETAFTRRNDVEHCRGCNRAQNLSDNITRQVFCGKPSANNETKRDRRIEVTAADMADGISHGQNRQTGYERNAQQADAHIRECSCQNGAAAAAKTALPQPPKTNQKVPTNSAINLFMILRSIVCTVNLL